MVTNSEIFTFCVGFFLLGMSTISSGSGLIPRLGRLDVEDDGSADKGFDAVCRPFAAEIVVSYKVKIVYEHYIRHVIFTHPNRKRSSGYLQDTVAGKLKWRLG